MRQLYQNLRTGLAQTEQVPLPTCQAGHLLIRSTYSLISPGTERMLADFGRASWIEKAKQQPERAKQVLNKIKTDGLDATLKAVLSKLGTPLPVGYSNVGVVIEVGKEVAEIGYFKVGDRVVSNGYHAEVVSVPKNLCVKVPDQVSDQDAAFAILGAISLQGIRCLNPTIGETFIVYGLGLLGVLAAQLLKANGCSVIGIDIDRERVDFASKLSIQSLLLTQEQDIVSSLKNLIGLEEVDGVLITASTSSNEPIKNSPRVCRQKGRVVLLGVVGLELERTEFFKKEITFQVSCSYGPGRYQPGYEQHGLDYPIGYVRWTENRNFSSILELIKAGALKLQSLVSEVVPFSEGVESYNRILNSSKGYAYLFKYEHQQDLLKRTIDLRPALETNRETDKPEQPSTLGIGIIGAGNYARATLLPAFAKALSANSKAAFTRIVTRSGVGSADLARKYAFSFHSSDNSSLLSDPLTKAVIIATRHDSHADLVRAALSAGKHVFVEKPLALSKYELEKVVEIYNMLEAPPVLMVGFNRRHSGFVKRAKQLLKNRSEPISFVMTINAGRVDKDHWTTDKTVGGGRIIGEVCHFIDLGMFFVEKPLSSISGLLMNDEFKDSVVVNLEFQDGSIGTINYFTNGHTAIPKERIEIFSSGRVIAINNFLKFDCTGFGLAQSRRLFKQDKGQANQAKEFINLIANNDRQINSASAEQYFASSRAVLDLVDSLGVG